MDYKIFVFLKKLLNPDMYGISVSAEVRDEVRELLGMEKVETLQDDRSNDPQ